MKTATGRRRARWRRARNGGGDAATVDPLEGVANLFDAGMVFALGLFLAVASQRGVMEILKPDTVAATVLKKDGSVEVLIKRGEKIKRYRTTEEKLGGTGKRVGVTYRLENGELVYIPDGGEQ